MPNSRRSRLCWCLLLVATPARGADFYVDSLADAHDFVLDGVCAAAGSGDCTLRAAVEEAENQGADDEIHLPAGTFVLSLGALPSLVPADGRLTITGQGHRDTKIRSTDPPSSRFIFVSYVLHLRDLELQNFSADAGGAILSSGTLLIDRCSLFANHATNGGGSIYSTSTGALYINYAAFADGTAGGDGGELLVEGGPFACNFCIFEGAQAQNGGAIRLSNGATGFIASSLFAGNSASLDGGAIDSEIQSGTFVLADSTVTGNTANRNGGGLALPYHGFDIYSSTITGNHADADLDGDGDGGGVYYYVNSGNILWNSILSGNYASITISAPDLVLAWPADCSGPVASNGYNLVQNILTGCGAGDNGCCTISGVFSTSLDPLLAPATYNGGSTRTQAIAPGSPALDAGDPLGCLDGLGNLLTRDQRGAARVSNGRCDLGAFEYGPVIFNDDFELWEWKWSAAVP